MTRVSRKREVRPEAIWPGRPANATFPIMPLEITTSEERPVGTWLAVKRGFRRRCPHCGQGKLFRGYLKQVDHCEACGEAFGHIRADDGPAWLTIMVVGHIVVPIMLEVELNYTTPFWLAMTVWPALTLALTLAFLPRAKGIFIGALWAMKAPGSELEPTIG